MLKTIVCIMMVFCFTGVVFSQSLVKWDGNWQCDKMLDEHTIVVFSGDVEKTVRIKAGAVENKDYIPVNIFSGNYCQLYTKGTDEDGVPIVMVFENGVYINDDMGKGIVFENNIDSCVSLSGAIASNSQEAQIESPSGVRWSTKNVDFNSFAAKWRGVRYNMSPNEAANLLGPPLKTTSSQDGNFNSNVPQNYQFTNPIHNGQVMGERHQTWILDKPSDFLVENGSSGPSDDFHFTIYYRWDGVKWSACRKTVHGTWYQWPNIREGFEMQDVTNEF